MFQHVYFIINIERKYIQSLCFSISKTQQIQSLSLYSNGAEICYFLHKTINFFQSPSSLSQWQSKQAAGKKNWRQNCWEMPAWSFQNSKAVPLTNTFWHIDVFWGSVTCINFKRQKQNCELSPSVLLPGLFDPDLLAVWACERLPGPTLDMRKPC